MTSEIGNPAVVTGNLSRWSRTPGLDLKDVTRIDVIARHSHLEYLGAYNLFFSGIILTWPASPVRGLRLWWRRLDAERTVYHEVGHHACGHLEGGQVPEQEDEADRYARDKMRRAHPVLGRIVRLVALPLRPLLRQSMAKVRQSRSRSA